MRDSAAIAGLLLLGVGAFILTRNAEAAPLIVDANTGYTPPYVPDNFDYSNSFIEDNESAPQYQPFEQTPAETNMTRNLDAFLRAIRVGEGAADDMGYYRLVGGGEFTDDKMHPGENIIEFPPGGPRSFKRGGFYNRALNSTAAGAYQITLSTWKLLRNKYGAQDFPDFSPMSQDNAAIRLIAEKPGAMNDVLAGRVDDAVYKVRRIWESLPGSGTRPQNEVSIADFRNYFQQYGGIVA